MKFFINAKPWMLFIVFFSPMLFSFIMSVSVIVSGGDMDTYHNTRFIVTALWMAVFVGWLWSLGTFLSPQVEASSQMRVHIFKLGLGYAGIYMLIFFGLMSQRVRDVNFIQWLIPFHFLAMACMFYSIYFVAKNLTMVEKKKQNVSFSDYAGDFMLLWFFPLGVWTIQPRINKLAS